MGHRLVGLGELVGLVGYVQALVCTGVLTCTVFFSKNLTRIAFKEKRKTITRKKREEKRKKNTIEKKEEAKILFH